MTCINTQILYFMNKTYYFFNEQNVTSFIKRMDNNNNIKNIYLQLEKGYYLVCVLFKDCLIL